MLTLVLVTHNSSQWLPPFAASWNRTVGACAPFPYPVIVADSGSFDGSLSLAGKLMTNVQGLSCGNIGYGAAANRAFALATTPWVLLCNPDLVFPMPFLGQLARISHLHAPRTACIAPQLLNPDNTPQPSVGTWPTLRSILHDRSRPRDQRKYIIPQPSEEAGIDWASGACLLFRKSAFDAVGGFDEKFFLYVEEVDLLKRLANAGWETWFVPTLSVIHLNSNALREPTPLVNRYAARGTLRYFAKHAEFTTLWGYRKMAYLSGRLPFSEAFSSRRNILARPTGP
jgi:N-acetylglucosaminyl-diphospho-decaprenol L-rhamnosyltransferase